MALIKCPDCKANISDSAKACPQCGCDYKSVLRNIEYTKHEIEYLQNLEPPKRKSSLDGLSVFFYMIAGACLIGAYLIQPLAVFLLPIGAFFLLSNILALIRGDKKQDYDAAMNCYLQQKNSIAEKKKKLNELESRFK